jgi:hypothetical protein
MDKAEKAKAALDRLFDNCEEIDYENYRMLDDIYIVKHYIDNQKKAIPWELVYHDDNPNYYAKYVTARCKRCGHWYGEIDEQHGQKYGKRLSAAFFYGYTKRMRSTAGNILMEDAERKIKDLPNFCENCGARMKGVRWNYDSILPDKKGRI